MAGVSTVASTRNDVAVKVDNSLLQCKYPTTSTKVTSDGSNGINIVRGQYQFSPGVSILAKMQYDTSVPSVNVCQDVEKEIGKKVSEKFSKCYEIDGVIYIGEGDKTEIETFLSSMMTANREGRDMEPYLTQLQQKYKVSMKDLDRIRLELLVTSPLMDDSGDAFYLIPFGKILSYAGKLTIGLGEGFQKILGEWGTLVRDTRGGIVIKNFSKDLYEVTKNGMIPLINKYGVNYRIHGVKIAEHIKNSPTFKPTNSYFLENMTEKDILQLHVDLMGKYDKDIWVGMLKKELLNGKGVIVEMGKVTGTYVDIVNGVLVETKNVTKLKFVSQQDGIIHAYPWK